MQRSMAKMFFSVSLLAVAATFIAAFTLLPGGDSYEIRLNNKVLLKQFVHQPVTVQSLSLGSAGSNDELVVYYSHCGRTGKGRSIAVSDTKNHLIKKWHFKDAGSGMVIPVKELLALEKKNKGSLQLHYSATELPEGRMLTSLQFGEKDMAYRSIKEQWPGWTAGSVLKMIP